MHVSSTRLLNAKRHIRFEFFKKPIVCCISGYYLKQNEYLCEIIQIKNDNILI